MKISFSTIGISINPAKGFVDVPDKIKKYDLEEVEKEENQGNQEEENKKGGNQEVAAEKMTFKKGLVEKKWFIRGQIDILTAGIEEELWTQWTLSTLQKITLKLKEEG